MEQESSSTNESNSESPVYGEAPWNLKYKGKEIGCLETGMELSTPEPGGKNLKIPRIKRWNLKHRGLEDGIGNHD